MRALAFAWAISIAAGTSAAAPQRVASLNLCTDELVLSLARPEQIATVTHLSRDPRESVLWRMARRYPSNDGSLMAAATMRPDLVVAMGGGGRDRGLIADAIGAKLIVLPYPQGLDDVEAAIARVAAALGRDEAGRALIASIREVRRSAPVRSHDAIFLSGGGRSLSADGIGAQWLRLAGLRQRPLKGDRIEAETMLTMPPELLVRSNYRADQLSREEQWLEHPALRRVRAPRVATDGRRWTCMGPTLLPEVMRLRRVAQASHFVIPAKAGIPLSLDGKRRSGIPAFAGMTGK
jgi:iron complex transport system substrate-binding protein